MLAGASQPVERLGVCGACGGAQRGAVAAGQSPPVKLARPGHPLARVLERFEAAADPLHRLHDPDARVVDAGQFTRQLGRNRRKRLARRRELVFVKQR